MQSATSGSVECTVDVSVVLLWFRWRLCGLSICYVLCSNMLFNTFNSLTQVTNSLILIVEASVDVVNFGAHIVAKVAQISLEFNLYLIDCLIDEVLEHVHSDGWCCPAHCLSRSKGLVFERITLLVIVGDIMCSEVK